MRKLVIFLFLIIIAEGVFSQPDPLSANIGIGTTATRAKLEVHGAAGATSAIFGGESSGISLQRNWAGIGFNEYYSTVSRYMADGFAAKMLLDANNGSIAFDLFGNGTANANTIYTTRALTIANNGNMGIKISPINASLCVLKAGNYDGSAAFGGTTYNSHFHFSGLEDTYIRGGRFGSRVYINDIAGGKIIFGAGTAKVNINSAGPFFYPLEIRQVNGRGVALVEPNNTFNNWEMRMGISTIDPTYGSDLNFLYNGQYKSLLRSINGEHLNYSDRRLKTNIEDMPALLDKIMLLNPVEYEMKYGNVNNNKTIGFIAQDVKQLFPELVSITTDTSRGYPGIADLHGLNYNGFTVLAIKALQEQQQLIKQMQDQNKELARRIAIAEAAIPGGKDK